MKNFTAFYLNSLKRKLLDHYGNPIQTIKYSEENPKVFYIPPNIEYDIIENKKQLKTPVLRESRDLFELKEEGLLLCSVPVTNSTKFEKKQESFMFLGRVGQVPLGATVITSMLGSNKKAQHRIIFDEANRRVKLNGPYAGVLGEGPWIQLDEN